MKTNLLIFFLMSLYFGCSKAPKTTTKFNLKSLNNLDSSLVDIGENGIIIFGFNDQGHRFAKVMNVTDDFNYDLDNGNWVFKAIAWDEGDPTVGGYDGVGDNFTGNPSCGISNIILNGSEVVVDLSLANTNCSDAEFSAGGKFYTNAALNNFLPLKDIYSCDESVGAGTTVTLGSECINDFAGYKISNGDDSFFNRGYHSSYQISVKSFYAGVESLTVGTTELTSECYAANDTASAGSNGLANLIDLQIPTGAGLTFSVQAFYTDDCSGRKNNYILNSGLTSDIDHIGVTGDDTPGAEEQILYLKSNGAEVCQGAGLTDDYAGGNGSGGKPYLICTADQLNKMYELGAVAYTKNYRLVRDIDMNTSTYHQDAVSPVHLIAADKNFKPLGYQEADVATNCTTANMNALKFSGFFDGGNHKIKNLKMDSFKAGGVYCDNVGLFGFSDSAKFARMNFENVTIDNAVNFSGVLVGTAFNTEFYGASIQGAVLNTNVSTIAASPLIGDFQSGSYEDVIYNNVQINNLSTPLTNRSQNVSGLCIGTGNISIAGTGLDSGPYAELCSSGGFNIPITLSIGSGQKDFTITHDNGSVANLSYVYSDGTGPSVVDVVASIADGNYTTSENIYIDISFSDDITVTGNPELTLNAGATAIYDSSPTTNSIRFLFTVAGPHVSADLDYASTSSLTLNGGTINGTSGGQAAILALPVPGTMGSISDDQEIVINGGAGGANITSIASSTGDGSYTTASVINIELVFDQVVTTSTSMLVFNNGATATYSAGSGSTTIQYTYTVAAGEDIANLNVSTFLVGDSGANAIIPGGSNLSDNNLIEIDTTAPTIVNITSTKTDGEYGAGEVIQISVQFDEVVTNVSGTSLTLDSGGVATFSTGGGSINHIFNYTVGASDNSGDLTVTAYNPASGTDNAGNLTDTTLPASNNLADNKNIVIDTIAPTVTITTFPHINLNNASSYVFSGTCSENGEPVAVDVGGYTGATTCSAGVWTSSLDVSALGDGPAISITADHTDLALNSATQALQMVKKDVVSPTVLTVADAVGTPPYFDGDLMIFTVTFSEPVEILTGATLDLNLNGSAASNQATIGASPLSTTHDFSFNVGQYHTTLNLDYLSSSSLIPIGSIRDEVGNDFNNVLPTPGSTGSLSDTSAGIKVLGGLSFDSTWDTDIAGGSGAGNVQLPLVPGLAYDFIVEWSPGVYEHITTDTIPAHNYGSGFQTIRIYGKFPSMRFNNLGDKDKLLTVPGLGNVGWESFENSFYGCTNLTLFDGGGGDTSMVTSMHGMFRGATAASPNTGSWITSNVTDMSYMFDGADAANPDTSSWDTSNVTDMSYMFRSADSANPDVSSWDTSSVTKMSRMFDNADSATPVTTTVGNIWNTSNVTEMISMFDNAALANPDVLGWDVSNVQNMSSMFRDAPNAAPLVGSWDTSNVTNMSFMFMGNIIANPQVDSWNVSNVTDMRNMFDGATNALPDMTSWDFSSVTNLDGFLDNGAGVNNYLYTKFLVAVHATGISGNLTGVTINTPAQYQAFGSTAHFELLGNFGWIINDGGAE